MSVIVIFQAHVESRLSKNIIKQARLQVMFCLEKNNFETFSSVKIQCVTLKAAEMDEEVGSGKARPNNVNLGGGDSDGEGVEEEDDDLEKTKYDEGEVVVNEEDELAVGFCVHWKEVMSKYLK